VTTLQASASLAGLACAPAHAFSIESVMAGGNDVDTSFSTRAGAEQARMLSLELGVRSTAPVSIRLAFDAGDPAVLPFNALLNNFVGLGFERISFDLAGASFALPLGTAAGSGFGAVAGVTGNASSINVTFRAPETFAATAGGWLLDGSAKDFGIVTSAGGSATLTITTAVPEPASVALMLAGLALVAGTLQRHRLQTKATGQRN